MSMPANASRHLRKQRTGFYVRLYGNTDVRNGPSNGVGVTVTLSTCPYTLAPFCPPQQTKSFAIYLPGENEIVSSHRAQKGTERTTNSKKDNKCG